MASMMDPKPKSEQDKAVAADQLSDQRLQAMYGQKADGVSAREHAHLRWLISHFVQSAPDAAGNRTYTFRGDLHGKTIEEAIDVRILAEMSRQGQEVLVSLREDMVRAAEQGPVHLDDVEQRVMLFLSKGHTAEQDAMRNVLIHGKKYCERATMLVLEQKGFVVATKKVAGAAVAWEATERGRGWKPG